MIEKKTTDGAKMLPAPPIDWADFEMRLIKPADRQSRADA